MSIRRDLEFLYELGSLRNMPRGWRQHLATDCASDLEHTMRVTWLALMIARMEGVKNEEKIMKMALAHDLDETRTSDHSYVQKVYVTSDEERAAHDTFVDTLVQDFEQVVSEYMARDCIEAKIVKDADNLDIDLELKELAEKGHQLPAKWQAMRQMVCQEKLYTESARTIWRAIQTSDPAAWHLASNKWLKIPNAGR